LISKEEEEEEGEGNELGDLLSILGQIGRDMD
jgi:hypothetical protein